MFKLRALGTLSSKDLTALKRINTLNSNNINNITSEQGGTGGSLDPAVLVT